MTKGYVDRLEAFRYRGHLIEVHVARIGKGPRTEQSPGTWIVRIGKDELSVFPASSTDTEDEVRERIRRWIDDHLPG